ncbi:MAG: hypothetical protein ACK5JS_03640 [Mangrovibacterium sp.]
MKKTVLLLLLVCGFTYSVNAQKLEWNVNFQGIGDNREFNPEYAKPQTILGERTSFELGTSIDKEHTLRIGLSHFFEFGTDIDYNKPQLTAYYKYDNSKTQFYMGAFPRYNLIDFPLAILSDTISYYQPNIEGILAQHNWNWGKQLIFVDWTGKQLTDQREKFIAATSGRFNWKNFYFENYLMMYHYALMAAHDDTQHIIDNTALNLNLGYDFSEHSFFNQAYVEIGFLNSQYRERHVTDGFSSSTSFFSTLFLEWRRLSLKNTLNLGGGHRLLTGDSYYQANDYMRTDLYLHLIDHKQVQLSFNFSFHVADWGTVDSQQQLHLVYLLGNK